MVFFLRQSVRKIEAFSSILSYGGGSKCFGKTELFPQFMEVVFDLFHFLYQENKSETW